MGRRVAGLTEPSEMHNDRAATVVHRSQVVGIVHLWVTIGAMSHSN